MQSQDLDGMNAAGDLPMVSRNVTERLDDLVKALQEQCENDNVQKAVSELDKAMEKLIFRLATGDDDKLQQTQSLKVTNIL